MFVLRVKIIIFYARIYSKTTTTILQNKDHNCPRPSVNDLQAFGLDQSTTPLALNRKVLEMFLQLHQMIQIGDLSFKWCIDRKRSSSNGAMSGLLDATELRYRPILQTCCWSFWL